MSGTIRMALIGIATTALIAACGGAESEAYEGVFVVDYETAASGETAVEEEFLRGQEILEDFAADMNDFVRLPDDVSVVAKDCDESNAFYDPQGRSITICYELAAEERANFAEAGDADDELDLSVYQSMVATLYHEVGHALIGELDLAITGREEDVADQMAAYVLTIDDESKDYLVTTANSYAFHAYGSTPHASEYADVHSLDEQRSVNFLCYVYGSDEEGFEYLVEDGVLDADRAESCVEEFGQLVEAWDRLLDPYVTY